MLTGNREAKWKSRTKSPSSASSLPPNVGPHDGLLEICDPAAVPCCDRHARQRDRSLSGFCLVRSAAARVLVPGLSHAFLPRPLSLGRRRIPIHPPPPFGLTELAPGSVPPERAYRKEELLGY